MKEESKKEGKEEREKDKRENRDGKEKEESARGIKRKEGSRRQRNI